MENRWRRASAASASSNGMCLTAQVASAHTRSAKCWEGFTGMRCCAASASLGWDLMLASHGRMSVDAWVYHIHPYTICTCIQNVYIHFRPRYFTDLYKHHIRISCMCIFYILGHALPWDFIAPWMQHGFRFPVNPEYSADWRADITLKFMWKRVHLDIPTSHRCQRAIASSSGKESLVSLAHAQASSDLHKMLAG